jgi:phosphoadenosine phosphosulfate reductase
MSTTTAAAQSLDLDTLNALFEKSHPTKIIEWAVAQFDGDVIVSSSFGAESMLTIHLATQVKPDIRIITIDTGFLFPETHQFIEQVRHRFHLNVCTFRTHNDPVRYLKEVGVTDPDDRADKAVKDACCEANKVEPLRRAMRELHPRAWFRGIRRDQSQTRQQARVIEWDRNFNNYAISPVLNWHSRDIYAYMKQHDLPYHPLYEKGYLSIGCNPLSCTRPVMPGDDPRSGRWAGSGKVECGVNLGSLDDSKL